MRVLRDKQEVIDFVSALTKDEACQLLRLINSKPEIKRAMEENGFVIRFKKHNGKKLFSGFINGTGLLEVIVPRGMMTRLH